VILIDSNVLIDLLGTNEIWHQWSITTTANAGLTDKLVINPVVTAEVAPGFGSLEIFLQKVHIIGAEVLPLSNEAASLGGMAFQKYRERRKIGQIGNEQGSSILADFLIGGHAQALGATILTRDSRFYRTYFPSVPLITPDRAEP
jgi:predicted nucleic acid-binding protein